MLNMEILILICSISKNEINVRTFEKGVEGETLSCGTGAIASSIAASFKKCKSPLKINFTGGSMKVTFTKNINIFKIFIGTRILFIRVNKNLT